SPRARARQHTSTERYNASGCSMRLRRRRPSEHLGRDNRILGSPAGEDALLQVDSIDPMAPEDVVAVILQDPPDAVEIPVPLHPGQGHMGLPRASLRRESERLE